MSKLKKMPEQNLVLFIVTSRLQTNRKRRQLNQEGVRHTPTDILLRLPTRDSNSCLVVNYANEVFGRGYVIYVHYMSVFRVENNTLLLVETDAIVITDIRFNFCDTIQKMIACHINHNLVKQNLLINLSFSFSSMK